MSRGMLLVACRIGDWRVAVRADALESIDRGRQVLRFREGGERKVQAIETMWETPEEDLLPLSTPVEGASGWVWRGEESFLCVEAGFFRQGKEPEAIEPAAPHASGFLGKLLVFQQAKCFAAVSMKQVVEVVRVGAVKPYPGQPEWIRGSALWRGEPIVVADWSLVIAQDGWQANQTDRFVIARSLRNGLVALPASAKMITEPTDAAAYQRGGKDTSGLFGWYRMRCGLVGLLDLDGLLTLSHG